VTRLPLRIAALALALASFAGPVRAQQPPAEPSPVAAPLPAAGAVPPNITLDVTGTPAADAAFLEAQIRAAIDRAVRPTLLPGASLTIGAFTPWPLLPLAAGDRTAVNVTVTVTGDATTAPVSGITTVTVANVAQAHVHVPPSVLFLSDDPEYLPTEGVVFRGDVTPARPARLYYYHSDVGAPRDLDVVLTASSPARVHLVQSRGGPELDVMDVGHTVSRDYLHFAQAGEGIVADVAPGRPFVVRHALLLQGEVVAGTADVEVVGGTGVTVSVLASAAGSRPDASLRGPRVPYDGHRRHGVFDLAGFGAISAAYTAGGAPASVQYGTRAPSPRNLDPADDGRDYGDYGVVHRITFVLSNPGDAPQVVYVYEKPLGGPVRSTFLLDGQMKEVGCVRLPQPYWIATYQLAPHSTGQSTAVTMTDGGSFYPLEVGVTDTMPSPYTPPVGSADGCSPVTPAFPDSGGGARRQPGGG
jgi:hypothetical protein